ncbi:MAG: hypothetical protein AAFX50_25515 [Acidobacteriota bacterium]
MPVPACAILSSAALSEAGLVIAHPDESSDDPYHFVLYEHGQKRAIEIVDDEDDEDMGQLRILERPESST